MPGPRLRVDDQYAELANDLKAYAEVSARLRRAFLWAPLRHPLRYMRSLRFTPRAWIELDWLRNERPTRQRLVTEFAPLSLRQSRWFSVLDAKNPWSALTDTVREHFSTSDIPSLLAYHEFKGLQLARQKLRPIFGFVLAAGTILLKSVPRSVIERRLRVPYAAYEEAVFAITLLLFLYLFIALSPVWLKLNRARSEHELIGDVLRYLAITDAAQAAQRGSAT